MARASDKVVIDHAGGLHESIGDGGAAKGETGLFQCLGHGLRGCGFGRYLACGKAVLLGAAVHERPQEGRESGPLFDGEVSAGAFDGAFDLATVAHYSGVVQQASHLGFPPARHDFRAEIGKGQAEIVALFQDGDLSRIRLVDQRIGFVIRCWV